MKEKLKRTDQDINDVQNWAQEAADNGESHFPGASYEEGVAAAIEWLLGYTNDNPKGE